MYECIANIMSRMFTLRNIVRIIITQNLSFLIFIHSIQKIDHHKYEHVHYYPHTYSHHKDVSHEHYHCGKPCKSYEKNRITAIAIN